ncbi:MAG: hypothetical protein WC453_04655 [Patescibacteria group bacterium]
MAQAGKKDTIIIKNNGIATLISRQVLGKIDDQKDGGSNISKLSTSEMFALFQKQEVPRREIIGSLTGVRFPVFYNWDIANDVRYRAAAGKLEADTKKVSYRNGGEYGNTILAYGLIFLTVFWTLRQLDKPKKTWAAVISLLGAAIIWPCAVGISYGVNWLLSYEVTAVGIFGGIVGIAAAICMMFVVALTDDDSINLLKCIILILVSVMLNIGAGKVAWLKYSLFSEKAEALWVFLGLYITIGLLAVVIRIIIVFFKKLNAPITIDMENDPDITKVVG